MRKGYGTSDHLQPIRILIDKVIEYNIPLWGGVGVSGLYKGIWALEQALNNSRIDYQFTNFVKHIYNRVTLQVQLHEITYKINICGRDAMNRVE